MKGWFEQELKDYGHLYSLIHLVRQRGLGSDELADGLEGTHPAARRGASPSSAVNQKLTPSGPADAL